MFTTMFVIGLIILVLGSIICASTPVTDTTSKVINGKDGTANFSIDNGTTIKSYACFFDSIDIREITEMTTADTFCIEGTADQEPGRSQLQFSITGLLKKGGALSGPLIPAPQNVAVIATFSTGCFFSFNANFTEATASRLVNQNARLSARGLSKASYTVTWLLS